MKILKKILRIITILLPCLVSCFMLSGHAFATTYLVDSFNAHGVSIWGNTLAERPQIFITPTLAQNPDFAPRVFANISSTYNSSNDKCEYYSYNKGNDVSYNTSYGTVTFGNIYSYSYPNNICMQYGQYGREMPVFLKNTIPDSSMLNVMSIFGQGDDRFPYMFSKTEFTGQRERDGIIYTGRLSLMSYLNNLFGSAEDSSDIDNNNANDRDWVADATDVRGFKLPLNFIVDEEIDSVTVEGSISFLPNDSQRETYASVGYIHPDFLSHGYIKIYYQQAYYDSSDILRFKSSQWSDPCSWSYSNSLLKLTYVCNVPLTDTAIEDGGLGLHLVFGSTNYQYQIFNSEDIVFNEIRVTTNGEDSPVVLGSKDYGGGFPKVAPGMPDIEDAYGNWSDSFMNAIKFSLLNPFLPLFSLFLPPDDCANIPTIATMIHSETTRICPIYPDWIYPITTPVFMIISSMLLFGFLIRWLNGESFSYIKEVKS